MRTLVLAGATLLFLAALVQLFSLRRTDQERESELTYGPANVLTLTHAVMSQTEGNELRIQVWADKAEYAEERSKARLLNVRFIAYPKPESGESQEPVEGAAAEAEVQGDASRLLLIGHVHIRRGEGTELKGERLLYDYRREKITSKDPVWMRHDKGIYQGDTLVYSVNKETIQLTRPFLWE